MGFTAKAKSSSEGWGMGFLLVFFPEDEPIDMNKNKPSLFSSSPSSPLPSPSSSSSPSSSPASLTFKPTITSSSPLRRTSSNHLLSRAQSTISICALLIFTTLLLFTLSTFEPTNSTAAAASQFTSRRHLSSSNPQFLYKPSKNSWSIDILGFYSNRKPPTTAPPNSHALQGLGNLYRRGTKAMNDLIVGHVTESVTAQELRLFLRLLHRSGLTSRSDLVLIFASASHSVEFEAVILEENESFLRLVQKSRELNGTVASSARFDVTQFVKSSKKEREWGETIWGRRIRSNYSDDEEAESTRLSYGSVVSFLVNELDPENSLAGFLDHVSMGMRRWACYPMLLGRVRRNFKHIMLVDVKEVLLLGDPLGRVRSRSPETVHLFSEATANKHGKKNSAKTQSHPEKPASSAVVMGGARGVRRLSNAMLTEIVRDATQHKKKSAVTESGLFNQLVGNEFILNNVKVAMSAESIPEASSLTESNSDSVSSLSLSNHHAVARRGNSNLDVTSSIMKQICSLGVDSLAYGDCWQPNN